jgi:hypothetical protein
MSGHLAAGRLRRSLIDHRHVGQAAAAFVVAATRLAA